MIHAQDQQIQSGGRSPNFSIKQRISYYDGTIEEFEYVNVSIYGYEIDMGSATDEISEKVTGFAADRKLTAATSAVVKQTTNDIIGGIAGVLATLPENPIVKAQNV